MSKLMKKLMLLFLGLAAFACSPDPFDVPLDAPSGHLSARVFTAKNGQLMYRVDYKGQAVLESSSLGFELQDSGDWGEGLSLESVDSTQKRNFLNPVWGEEAYIEDHYKAYTFSFSDKKDRKVNLYFKMYDDGLGLRYEFAEENTDSTWTITDEHTTFQLTGDHTAWWIPADYDSYEYLYQETLVSEIDSNLVDNSMLAAHTIQERHAVNTPLTMQTATGLYLSIHEANLTDYASMTLKVEADKRTLKSDLVPSREGWKAQVSLPFKTPWRTLQVAEKPGDLMTSQLMYKLNESNAIGNTDWVKPGKYIGIWWEMHLQKSNWAMEKGDHGATTENAKRHIDFAAKHGFDGVLIEGWNTGWENWIGFPDREGIFDFVTPYSDYDLEAVNAYAQGKGVHLVMHHETSAAINTYEQQLDTAYVLMKHLGIPAVKTGYVGPIIPEGEHHHGQFMVQHYRKVVEKAAENQVMVLAHEPIKATGTRRTFPNMMAREGLRGSEFNSPGGKGNPPEHLTIVPFTRMLGGPIDYTPGLFKLQLDAYQQGYSVPTTLAYQLASYVVVYSPWQMASDLIEHYDGHPAFQFIKDVPVDWETTQVLDAEIGDYVVVARLEKGSYDWYVGGLTDENARDYQLNLDFLKSNVDYEATLYLDAEDADFERNPEAYTIRKQKVKKGEVLELKMARGGGFAIQIRAL